MAYFTLIAHKPESSSFCMGCHMDTYYGAFDMAHGPCLDALAPVAKHALLKNANLQVDEVGYDITLLINGIPLDVIKASEPQSQDVTAELRSLAAEAEAWLGRLEAETAQELEAARLAEKAAKEAEAQKLKQEQEARDRAQYLALQARFGGEA